MVEKIRAFREHRVVVAAHRRERELHAFLAELLRDPSGSFAVQARGVAAVRALLDPPRNDPLERRQEGETLG